MFKRKKKRSREFKNLEKVIDLEEARAERRERRKQLATKKENKFKKSASYELSERKANKRNRKRLIYFFVILGIIVVIGVSIFRVYSLQKEHEAIIAQNKALLHEKQKLTEELRNVNNPEYVEQQARAQLRMIKPGEILFIIPQTTVTGSAIIPRAGVKLLPAGEASD